MTAPAAAEHPVHAALRAAPLDTEPESDEEREAVAAAKARADFVSHDEVSAALAARRSA